MRGFATALSNGLSCLAIVFLVLSLLAAPTGTVRADGGGGGGCTTCPDGYVCDGAVCTLSCGASYPNCNGYCLLFQTCGTASGQDCGSQNPEVTCCRCAFRI